MPAVKIAVIGCGYWGPNLVRTFLEIPDVEVVAVADRDPARLEHVRSRHPQIPRLVRDYHELFEMDLDAVVVATPPETHFEVAKICLEHGLDVMVEKPLTTEVDRAVDLVELAAARDRILMVGHIGAYNPAVVALKEMVQAGDLGEIRYVDAVRAGLGLFHPTLNVVWDLAPHDVAILLNVLGETPITVSARGIACVQGPVEDVAYMAMMFESGVMAHTRLSWLDPYKSRRITIVGSKKMVVYDDLEVHEKLKVYDKGVNAIRQTDTFGDYQFSYHYGSVVSPYIHFEEPLRLECMHFVECVTERTTPTTDGANGVEVVRVIAAAQRSLRSDGATESIGGAPAPAMDQPRLDNVVWIPEAKTAIEA
ncbi:MAG: Gfo/Idh/MocA family oxidoreductase [Actinomycetota bacterium]